MDWFVLLSWFYYNFIICFAARRLESRVCLVFWPNCFSLRLVCSAHWCFCTVVPLYVGVFVWTSISECAMQGHRFVVATPVSFMLDFFLLLAPCFSLNSLEFLDSTCLWLLLAWLHDCTLNTSVTQNFIRCFLDILRINRSHIQFALSYVSTFFCFHFGYSLQTTYKFTIG